jgi:uncharacterized membrane protein HdeD (DUF308 family)
VNHDELHCADKRIYRTESRMTTPHPASPGQPGTGTAPDLGASVPAQPGPAGQGEQAPPDDQAWPSSGAGGPDADRVGPDFARTAWTAFLAAGLACLAVGVMLLIWPKATLTIAAVLIGASLVVAGLLRLIDGFTAHDESGGRRAASVVVGLLAIIVGLYFIRHHNVTIAVLAIVVGLFWVMHGIADIVAGLFLGPFPGRGLTVVGGVFSLIAGLVVLFWPSISVAILVAVIGIWLVIYGVLMTTLALRLRRSAIARPGTLAAT